MFKSVSPKLDVISMEEAILKFWKQNEIFKKTIEQREGGPEYVFYEGPPTANGKPGVHHVLARAFKDMFPRYKIMRGYHVSRYVYPPGTVFPDHTHAVDKIDAVLSGRFRITLEGDEIVLKAGDAVEVPRGAVHSAEVIGDHPVVSLDAVRRGQVS